MLVDSNIIIYSLNSSSPKKDRAQVFLQNNKESLSIAHQNVFESIRVLTHPKFSNPMTLGNAVKSLTPIIDGLTLVYPHSETFYIAMELLTRYNVTADRIFDVYLVATMLSNGIFRIATDNVKDFGVFKEIEVFNPFLWK